MTDCHLIRPYRSEDFDAVTALWRRSRIHAMPDLHARIGHTPEEDRAYFQNVILPKCDLWVAEVSGAPVAFIAIGGGFIDQLYVDPDHQNRGIGAALLNHAKSLSPAGLKLFTHQTNTAARNFYERQGFILTKLGTSPPPESEPDVKYDWTPTARNE